MKYVILAVKFADTPSTMMRVYPFVFPDYMVHAEVAKRMIQCVGMESGFIPEVHSAGFCNARNNAIQVVEHGSESLRIKSDPSRYDKDQRILNLPGALQGMISED